MTNPLLEHPTPDFVELERVLKGEQEPRRAHLVELGIDREVLQLITERYLGQPWVSPTKDPQEPYLEQLVTLYYRLGYDYVPTGPVWVHHPSPRRRRTEDTAALSRGESGWAKAVVSFPLGRSSHSFPGTRSSQTAHPANLRPGTSPGG